MSATLVVPGVWNVPLGVVNVSLFDTGDGLTLVDTGVPGSAPKILAAVASIGRTPGDVKRVVVTHCHPDHAGSLAEVKRLTGAAAFMHPLDAAFVRRGEAFRPVTKAPGVFNKVLGTLILATAAKRFEPAEVEHEVNDGDTFPGGLRVVHAPGHCAGQVALHKADGGGLLVAADACTNILGLGVSPVYEDLAEGLRSLARLSALDFEAALFGHGKPVTSGASAKFRKVWPAARDAKVGAA